MPTTTDLNSPPTEEFSVEQQISPEQDELFNFQKIKKRLTNLIDKHKECVKKKIAENREMRFIDIDLNAAAFKDKIEKNDLMILVRSINTNIKREQPTYVAYLKQPDRLAVFTTIANPMENNNEIEGEFHRGLTYAGWDVPYIKTIDAGQEHGWSFVEVVFDETKPFHVGIEFIDPGKLIFHTEAEDLQAQEIIIREYPIVPKDLKKSVVKFGFDQVEVDELIKDLTDDKKDLPITIYKKYCKYDGVVYVSWFHTKGNNWLKAPAPIHVGRLQQNVTEIPIEIPSIDPLSGMPMMMPSMQQQVEVVEAPEEIFPIFTFVYDHTELAKIIEAKGRVFHDKYKQEARTANLSAFASSCLRAADTVISPKQVVESSSKLEGFTYKHGAVAKTPVDFFNSPYPSGEMLTLAQYLDAFDAEEAGRPSYAVQKKSPGARVTAEQIKSARQDQSQLNALQVNNFSFFLRNVLTYVWGIVQSRALNDRITFLQNPETGQNDYVKIGQDYDIKAAGDTDVIKKSELLQLYMDFWPIVAPTAAAPMYLAKMLKLAFGREGNDFIGVLETGDPRMILLGILDTLKVTLDPEEVPRNPQAQLQLQNLIQQAEVIVAPMRAMMTQQQPGGQVQGQQNQQPQQPESIAQ